MTTFGNGVRMSIIGMPIANDMMDVLRKFGA